MVKILAIGGRLCPPFGVGLVSAGAWPISWPTFTFQDGSFLARSVVSCLLHVALPQHAISSRSPRRGGASALGAMGYPAHVILIMGKWRPDAIQSYDDFLHAAASAMARATACPVFQQDR